MNIKSNPINIKNNPINIVCVGDCGLDHYLPSGEKFVGGITANFACNARKAFAAGDSVQVISALGDDNEGQRVLAFLESAAVECHISRLPGATPLQYIEVRDDGERVFVGYHEGVLKNFRFDELQQQIIQQSDLLVAPVFLQIQALFERLLSIPTQGMTAIDFADFSLHPDFDLLERHIAQIDIGFFGLSIDDSDTIDRIAELARQHQKLLVVTLGADGSRAYHGGERIDCAALPVSNVVDTTGAGDAFAAGFLSSYCIAGGTDADMDQIIEKSLTIGAQLAAQAIVKLGAEL